MKVCIGSTALGYKWAFLIFLLLLAQPSRAGMTVYQLTDVAKLRLEDISFFGFLFILACLGIRILWNSLARDFPRLPRLSFLRSVGLTALLGLGSLLVLIMISGARELLTPGAWQRQASHYRLNGVGNLELREQSIRDLRAALFQYAQAHGGQFPPHDYVLDIPDKLWQAPDSTGTRYLYIGGLSLGQSNSILACEPQNFGDDRLVLLVNGEIKPVKTADLYKLLGVSEQP